MFFAIVAQKSYSIRELLLNLDWLLIIILEVLEIDILEMTSQKLLSVFLVLASVLLQINADSLVVEHHPSYQTYDYNSGTLKFSDFKDVLLASHGFSLNNVRIVAIFDIFFSFFF